MPPEIGDKHEELLRLMRENRELLKENQTLLKKMYRNDMIGVGLRVVWYAVLIGLPFALYFYVFEPYFTALGSDYEVFKRGMAEIPGLKGFEGILPK